MSIKLGLCRRVILLWIDLLSSIFINKEIRRNTLNNKKGVLT